MIFSPVFGLISDRMGSVRFMSLLCCSLFTSGNVLYAIIGIFAKEINGVAKIRMWIMIAARLVVGTGTAINSTARSYVSSATLLAERTTHIAYLSLFQTLGFILGPLIQALLAFLGQRGTLGMNGEFYVDMYTATG